MTLKKRLWRWLKTWNIWELDGCDEDISQEKKTLQTQQGGKKNETHEKDFTKASIKLMKRSWRRFKKL